MARSFSFETASVLLPGAFPGPLVRVNKVGGEPCYDPADILKVLGTTEHQSNVLALRDYG